MRFTNRKHERFVQVSKMFRAVIYCKDSGRTFTFEYGYNPRRSIDHYISKAVIDAKLKSHALTGYTDARLRLVTAKVF